MRNNRRFSHLHHIPPAKLRTFFETTKFFPENLSDSGLSSVSGLSGTEGETATCPSILRPGRRTPFSLTIPLLSYPSFPASPRVTTCQSAVYKKR